MNSSNQDVAAQLRAMDSSFFQAASRTIEVLREDNANLKRDLQSAKDEASEWQAAADAMYNKSTEAAVQQIYLDVLKRGAHEESGNG